MDISRKIHRDEFPPIFGTLLPDALFGYLISSTLLSSVTQISPLDRVKNFPSPCDTGGKSPLFPPLKVNESTLVAIQGVKKRRRKKKKKKKKKKKRKKKKRREEMVSRLRSVIIYSTPYSLDAIDVPPPFRSRNTTNHERRPFSSILLFPSPMDIL